MKLINRILGVILLIFAIVVIIFLFKTGPYSLDNGCNEAFSDTSGGVCFPRPTIIFLLTVVIFFVIPPLTAFILSWKYVAKRWSFIVVLSVFSLYILLVLTVVTWILHENYKYRTMYGHNETHTFIA